MKKYTNFESVGAGRYPPSPPVGESVPVVLENDTEPIGPLPAFGRGAI